MKYDTREGLSIPANAIRLHSRVCSTIQDSWHDFYMDRYDVIYKQLNRELLFQLVGGVCSPIQQSLRL